MGSKGLKKSLATSSPPGRSRSNEDPLGCQMAKLFVKFCTNSIWTLRTIGQVNNITRYFSSDCHSKTEIQHGPNLTLQRGLPGKPYQPESTIRVQCTVGQYEVRAHCTVRQYRVPVHSTVGRYQVCAHCSRVLPCTFAPHSRAVPCTWRNMKIPSSWYQ